MSIKKRDVFKAGPYLLSGAMVAIVTALFMALGKRVDPSNFAVLYTMVVVISAAKWGVGPSVFSSVAGVLAFDFFFVHPFFTFAVSDFKYIYIFAGYLAVGIIVSLVASASREQALEANAREQRTFLLHRFSRELAACDSMKEVADSVIKNTGELLESKTAVFMGDSKEMHLFAKDPSFPVDSYEQTAVAWAISNGSNAGRGAKMFADSKCLYVPLTTAQGAIGILGFYKEEHTGYDMEFVEALSGQSSVALQRAKFAEKSRLLDKEKETGRLQSILLNSISHDLRTPLVSITGALSTLKQDFDSIDTLSRNEILRNAYAEAQHLNMLVGNLLDITRVESGTLKLKMNIKLCDLRDVIGSSLRVLKDRLADRVVAVEIMDGIFELPVDYAMMMRVFINLIDNAAKYSAPDSDISISAKTEGENAIISVADKGFGIPTQDIERIFDKFYRAEKPRQVSGTGLGLAICRGIVEAHGGRILAANNPDKGAVISVAIPARISKEGENGK